MRKFLTSHRMHAEITEIEHIGMGLAYGVGAILVHHPAGSITVGFAYFATGVMFMRHRHTETKKLVSCDSAD